MKRPVDRFIKGDDLGKNLEKPDASFLAYLLLRL